MNKRFILVVFACFNMHAIHYAEATSEKVGLKYMYWVSDIHVDKYYSSGSPDRCLLGTSSGMKCCRKYDIAEKRSKPASTWGDYFCDSPELLVRTFMETARNQFFETFPPSFFLQTGDMVDHHDLFQNFDSNMDEIEIATNSIRKIVGRNAVMAIGNHDTWPVDQLSVPNRDNETRLTRKLYSFWSDFFPFAHKSYNSANTFLKGGYYATNISKNITAIVINTLYYDTNNILVKGVRDPAGQYAWIRKQLEKAKIENKCIWIIGHIPPGRAEATREYTQFMWNITITYKNNICAQMFGHTHLDSLVLYDGCLYTDRCPVAMVMPSLLPENHEPALRIVGYEESSGKIVDYETFSLNLGNMILGSRPEFRNVWKASLVFGSDMNIVRWHSDALRSAKLQDQYWYWHHVGSPPTVSNRDVILESLQEMVV